MLTELPRMLDSVGKEKMVRSRKKGMKGKVRGRKAGYEEKIEAVNKNYSWYIKGTMRKTKLGYKEFMALSHIFITENTTGLFL